MPPSRATQGASKVDWVAVWFWLRKVKMTVSPTVALSSCGLKARPCGPPTVTLWVAPPAPTVPEGGAASVGLPVATAGGGVAAAPPPTVCVTVTV
jgi:hypothetical protein